MPTVHGDSTPMDMFHKATVKADRELDIPFSDFGADVCPYCGKKLDGNIEDIMGIRVHWTNDEKGVIINPMALQKQEPEFLHSTATTMNDDGSPETKAVWDLQEGAVGICNNCHHLIAYISL